ncbi:uncharacterized protein LOC109070810 isoform X1 [Cyprinus carpio]|uniref:Uncharacterized protein n=3 Tax=Cyprinus carpio TaxID=7962 RepID=A0A8C1D016_CYPCA|nr:uncharacterized protein LOC109070810 isoform X1 [Cyprinus carpio]
MLHFPRSSALSEDKQLHFISEIKSYFLLIIQAATMASGVLLRHLVIILCLLHLHVQSIEGVNTVCLDKMTQYFYKHVQPKQGKKDLQYALAIAVHQDQCTNEQSDIQTEFSLTDAANVRNLLIGKQKCELCTSSKNVIASRPIKKKKEEEHSEHVLLYPVGTSLMDNLLEEKSSADCVVFFSYNSPCVKTCLQSDDNIMEGLRNWINKRKAKMNAFVFQDVWQNDKRSVLEEEFKRINAIVPLYRCARTADVMKCQKCVENNVVDSFCLPDKNPVLFLFQEMFTSAFQLWSVVSELFLPITLSGQ